MSTPLPTPDAGPADDAGLRGRLEVSDRVAQKIVAQAAGEVGAASGTARRVFGVAIGEDRPPQVEAHLDDDLATVRIALAVAWPSSITQVTRQVRARVQERLGELLGVTRSQVDIRVVALPAAPAAGRVS